MMSPVEHNLTVMSNFKEEQKDPNIGKEKLNGKSPNKSSGHKAENNLKIPFEHKLSAIDDQRKKMSNWKVKQSSTNGSQQGKMKSLLIFPLNFPNMQFCNLYVKQFCQICHRYGTCTGSQAAGTLSGKLDKFAWRLICFINMFLKCSNCSARCKLPP